MLLQLGYHAAGQADRAAAGAGLGQTAAELALDLGDDLGDLDGAAQQVDAAAGQAGELTDTQAPVGADQDQGAIARVDRIGQAGDLGRGEKPRRFALDPGQADGPARGAGEQAGVNRGGHDLAEHLVALGDGAGGEALSAGAAPGCCAVLARQAAAGRCGTTQAHPEPSSP